MKKRDWNKIIRNDFDYDYGFLLKLERHKLKRMKKFFESKECIIADSERLFIVRDIRICINLLNMILEDKFNNRYTNIRNSKRFVPDFQNFLILESIIKKVIREEKVWYLYHYIRYNRMRYWWE